jgi:uncharacterized protein (DUF1501 family)
MTMTTSEMAGSNCGCEEYGSSRRAFLASMLGATAGTVGVTMFGDTFRQVALAGGRNSNVLVVLSMRGGADSLSIVVPHAERGYYSSRPGIAVPRDRLFARDATFGLHPALRPLAGMWASGRMAAVVATGLAVPNRSHFAAIEAVEDADPGSSARRGWINRMVGLDAERRPQEAVALGTGVVPASMWGPTPTLAARKVDSIDLAGAANPDQRRRKKRSLAQTWSGVGGPLGDGARTTLRTIDTMAGVANRPYRPAHGARYPDRGLGAALKDTARLIKARLGVEVVTIDFGGWDMHTRLASVDSTNGKTMTTMLTELAQALSAFFTDLGAHANRVTVVTITEFGRRLVENGSAGLDHGWASAMLLLGGGVRGGRYYGKWPGLTASALVDGDLAVTTDYRNVLTEVIRSRFNADTSRVFPGFIHRPVGAMT